MDDVVWGPVPPIHAKRLIRDILQRGVFSYSRHAKDEMLKDAMTTLDCENVLRAGVVQPPELERGTWRHRVDTARMAVVIAFRSEMELIVITAWRRKS